MILYYLGNPDQPMDVLDAEIEIWKSRGYEDKIRDPAADIQPDDNTKPVPGGEEAPKAEAWVDSLYQKYFDRPATASESENWSKTLPAELEAFLQQETDIFGYVSQDRKKANDDALANAFQIIDDDMNLTPEMRSMAKEVIRAYEGGIEADAADILATFRQLKEQTIDPCYKNLFDVAIKELKQSVGIAEEERTTELEQEGVAAETALAEEQAVLESTGLSRTGAGVKAFGSKGAVQAKEILPFGGVKEGAVPQLNRLIATTSRQRFAERMKRMGMAGEKLLGSKTGIPGIVPGYDPIGAMTGTLAEQQQAREADVLSDIAKSAEEKKKLLINIQPNL